MTKKKQEKWKMKNIRFPIKLYNEAQAFVGEDNQFPDFSKMVRDATRFYIDFWFSDKAVEKTFEYIDKKVESKEFLDFVARLFLRIQDYKIKHPEIRLSDIPFWPKNYNTEEYLKNMEKELKKQLEQERKQIK